MSDLALRIIVMTSMVALVVIIPAVWYRFKGHWK